MEEQNHIVYNRIAKHFSDTRSWVTDDLVQLGTYTHSGDRVLDLACGNARLYQLFVEEGSADSIQYTGVDFSENLLAMARERFPHISVSLGDMRKIPCSDQSFDVVYCLAAFHHLATDEDRLTALREMYRVLKPTGRLVMTNWNIFSDWAKEKLASGKWTRGKTDREIIVPWRDAEGTVLGERLYYAYTPEELTTWCEQIGFNITEQFFAVKKGSTTDPRDVGMNIVTVATRR